MSQSFTIRIINLNDAAATLKIYQPYVLYTPITFEYEVPTLQEWENRIKTYTANYPWLVCECNDEMIGYAYANSHRYRTAYSWSVESTIYLSETFHGVGVARVLYETLFDILRLQGYVNVYAGVTIPNVKSERFHESLNFYDVGVFKKIGYKLGAWHDTRWFQLHLMEHTNHPAKPKSLSEVENTSDFHAILEGGNRKLADRTGKISQE